MYTVIISVPFRRRDARRCEVASDWGRSLILLRDSLQGRFGPITVAAPELYEEATAIGDQVPHEFDEQSDEISFRALGDTRWRARQFWCNAPRLRAECDRLAGKSDIVHCGINDLWQPYSLFGFQAAIRNLVTTVFVLDGDEVRRRQDLLAGQRLAYRIRTDAYSAVYSRVARAAVARADLALLKGRSLHDRYGRFAKNAKDFFDTSYSHQDVIRPERTEQKCRELQSGEAIRCLYLGRLVEYKGIEYAVRAIAQAVRRGARLSFDIIGQGPAEVELRRLVSDLGAQATVRFLGSRVYGPDLLQDIQQYHLMLFTSLAEETPRSLFDGMAAGCGLLAFEIPFTQQIVELCQHGAVVPRADVAGLAGMLHQAHYDRKNVIGWMKAASSAASYHASEVWYRRRAEWTVDAFEQKQHDLKNSPMFATL